MTKIGLIQFLLMFLISAAYGQKVKYKDIFALLSTKQFEQAEPFLKQYLKETTDNPNAFLFMGNIFQDKSSKNDVLKQTSVAIANMDSAILYYDKAYKTLDEREVRKNKEYYQGYNRRDLRTGDFGVKLPDIQFDIEKRIESLKERIGKVKALSHYFYLADITYKRANILYISLQGNFSSKNELYLRANEQTLKDLSTLSLTFDSCTAAFGQYKSIASSLGKTGYSQRISLASIIDFQTDGRPAADFFGDEIRLWDYKTFADESRSTIENEVLPMRRHLVTYDTEINKLREKLNADSVSIRNDLTKLIDKLLYDQLKKFDAEPLPMTVFALKTGDLEYKSMLLEHRQLRDSADVHFQINMLNREMALLEELDSTSSKLTEKTLEEKSLDYAEFINKTFGSPTILKDYVRSVRDFCSSEKEKKSVLLAKHLRMRNYIIDGSDSIPLTPETGSVYRPLTTTPEKFTTGLSTRDTTQLQGYFYTIAASRRPDVKAVFPVDKSAFKTGNISAARALAYSDAAGQIYYVLVYSEKAIRNKFPATLAKIYRSDGLAWKIDYPLTFTPSELMVSAETGELVIRNADQRMVVDKNGKVKSNLD